MLLVLVNWLKLQHKKLERLVQTFILEFVESMEVIHHQLNSVIMLVWIMYLVHHLEYHLQDLRQHRLKLKIQDKENNLKILNNNNIWFGSLYEKLYRIFMIMILMIICGILSTCLFLIGRCFFILSCLGNFFIYK